MIEPSTTIDDRALRKFGLLFSSVLMLLFELLIPWLRERPWPLWPLYIAAPIATLALVLPATLRPFYTAWMKFGSMMGSINTRIIMSVLFFALLTPTGWLMRALNINPLARTLDRSAISYRIASTPNNKEDLEKPY